jgi:hypothetical protein
MVDGAARIDLADFGISTGPITHPVERTPARRDRGEPQVTSTLVELDGRGSFTAP